ncbi:MAG: acyl-[ACP]--phospholipid O-acyltransferase [Alphaproteobacteria bacterium]|nr:acyl-[ACP]--phospholipid O-acyltransferase [Alphaproteobacteria bacterium]MCB9975180.1 acyl-[ACP]--phospholipid O-acyltransferase [Rhodospirillales bacterium]
MEKNQFDLLKDRRFLPLFITQFLGAFNDNIFKMTLSVLVGYEIWSVGSIDPKVLVSFAAGLFIFPFLVFAPLAGDLADKYNKDTVIRWTKLAEIVIAILGGVCLVNGGISGPSVYLGLFVLLAFGAQSAFFSPSKYSILPQHLKEDELIGGNALLNTGTFIAILTGTIFGGVLAIMPMGLIIVAVIMVGCAVSGYVASRYIPVGKANAPGIKLNYNLPAEAFRIIRYASQQPKGVFLAILGASWFFFVGGTMLAQFPNFTKNTLGVDQLALVFFMTVFSVGIGIGGLANNRLLRSRIEATYVPVAALGIALFSLDLYFASLSYSGPTFDAGGKPVYASLLSFLPSFSGIRVTFDIFMISVMGGLYVIPLAAIVQHFTPDDHKARVLAASGLIDSLFILLSSLVAIAVLGLGFEVQTLFLLIALAGLGVAVYVCMLLPDYLFKTLLQGLFKLLYKVEVHGLENYEKAGPRALIVGNHVSLLDPPLLAAFLPGRPMFAVNSFVAEWFWVKPFLKLVDAFPLDPTNPFSIKSLIKEVEKDKHCVIFPEGRLTETGALMKVYEGPGMIADKSEAVVIPVRLDGVQHTPFARLKGKVPLRNFPKITITILEPRTFRIPDEYKGRARRRAASRQLYNLMEEMMFLTQDREQTLYQALMKARHVNGDNEIIMEDIERKPVTFKKLVRGSVVLGRKFTSFSEKGENVGFLMPNSCGAILAFFGLQAFGRVPAMLNFSAGAQSILAACHSAQIKTVISSRRFIEFGRLSKLVEEMETQVTFVYLEDLREKIGILDKIRGLYSPITAEYTHKRQGIMPNDPAVILFTSGSEGLPKGVVLSHSNIMANIVQLTSRVDFNRQDIVFNCLPIFHSFGLTAGTLLPILCGIRTFFYPSPLHYRIVPEMVYSTNASIMFGTDTFLNGYARMADPYDFYRMRYIFAGAEKVKDETKKLYMERFGVRVLEGYGATETSPALTLNAPMHLKAGTVGRLLPGIEYRLEDVPGVEQGGRLYVRGPNVMLGYYLHDKPGVIQPPEEGWHDTGDIVDVDAQGFVTILGRAKRFAKIAGEMVSLTSVETLVSKVYPDFAHAVVAVPDARKGEQLVLATTCPDVKREALSKYAGENGISELAVPKTILHMDKLPVLGSGKTDYAALKALVEERLAKAA